MIFIDEVLTAEPNAINFRHQLLKDAVIYKLVDFNSILTEKDKSLISLSEKFDKSFRIPEEDIKLIKEKAITEKKSIFKKIFEKISKKVNKQISVDELDQMMLNVTTKFREFCEEKPPCRPPFPFVIISGKDSMYVCYDDFEKGQYFRTVEFFERSNETIKVNGQLKKEIFIRYKPIVYTYVPDDSINLINMGYSIAAFLIKKHPILKTEKKLRQKVVHTEIIQNIPHIIKTNRLFSLLTCKNAIVKDEKEEPSKKHKKKGIMSNSYKTVYISLNKKTDLINISNMNGDNKITQRAGHYKTYTEKAPLFGKIVGTIWVPPIINNKKRYIVN